MGEPGKSSGAIGFALIILLLFLSRKKVRSIVFRCRHPNRWEQTGLLKDRSSLMLLVLLAFGQAKERQEEKVRSSSFFLDTIYPACGISIPKCFASLHIYFPPFLLKEKVEPKVQGEFDVAIELC